MAWGRCNIKGLQSITVEPAQFLYMLGSYMSYGVFQDLVYFKVCFNKFHDEDLCSDPDDDTHDYIQKQSAYWFRYSSIAEFIPSLLALCLIGTWSDFHSRKVPLLIPPLGAVLNALVFVFLSYYKDSSVAYVVLAELILGISGTYSAMNVAAITYVNCISTEETRTTRIAVVEAMTFVGGTVGPLISGAMLDKTGHGPVFLLYLAINAAAFFYIVIRIKDVEVTDVTNMPQGKMEIENVKSQSTLSKSLEYIYSSITTCFRRREGRLRVYVICLVLAYSALMVANSAESETTYLFVKDEPLKWSFEKYSLYSSVRQGTASFAILVILPLIRRFLMLQDFTLSMIGYISKAGGLLLLTFGVVDAVVYVSVGVSCFRYFASPVIRAMLSKLVPTDEQGRMMTALALADSIWSLIGSVVFDSLYPPARYFFHGLCFLIAAVFVVFSAGFICYIRYDTWKRRRNPLQASNEHIYDPPEAVAHSDFPQTS